MMKYYNDTDYNKPNTAGAKLLKVERNKLNPLVGLTFVSIGYWKLTSGEVIGIVFKKAAKSAVFLNTQFTALPAEGPKRRLQYSDKFLRQITTFSSKSSHPESVTN